MALSSCTVYLVDYVLVTQFDYMNGVSTMHRNPGLLVIIWVVMALQFMAGPKGPGVR